MIIKGKGIDQLTSGGAQKYRAVLFFGPDEGRVRECATLSARSIVEDLTDPFRVASLDGADLKSDPALLSAEAAAISMTGGRRVVRLRNLGDSSAASFEEFLQHPVGDSLLVCEAGELSKTSKLRKLFESSPICAIAACYEDNPEDLEALIIRHLKQNGLDITSDAKAHLLLCLGEDRLATRQELDKLVLYMMPPPVDACGKDGEATADILDSAGSKAVRGGLEGMGISGIQDGVDIRGVKDIRDGGDVHDGSDISDVADIKDSLAIQINNDGRPSSRGYNIRETIDTREVSDTRDIQKHGNKGQSHKAHLQVTLQDVVACIGDSSAQGLDGICDAMALGDAAGLDFRLSRAFDASTAPVAILRSAANHLVNLQLVCAQVIRGSSADQALRSLRPPLHFSRSSSFRQQIRLWDLQRLAKALDLLLQGEAGCKTTGSPDQSICRQTLLQTASLARPNAHFDGITPRGRPWDRAG